LVWAPSTRGANAWRHGWRARCASWVRGAWPSAYLLSPGGPACRPSVSLRVLGPTGQGTGSQPGPSGLVLPVQLPEGLVETLDLSSAVGLLLALDRELRMLVQVHAFLVQAKAFVLAQRRDRYLYRQELGEERREVDLRLTEDQQLLLGFVQLLEPERLLGRSTDHGVDEVRFEVDRDLGQAASTLEHGGGAHLALHDEVIVAPGVDDVELPLGRALEGQAVSVEKLGAWLQQTLCFDLGFAARRVVKQGG